MVEKIEWLPEAEQSLDEVMLYLRFEQSLKAAQNYYADVKEAEDKIRKGLGRKAPKDDKVRFVLVRKRWRMYFRRNEEDILNIVSYFDTKRHPDNDPYQ